MNSENYIIATDSRDKFEKMIREKAEIHAKIRRGDSIKLTN